jgi:serine-protein kinase ATM
LLKRISALLSSSPEVGLYVDACLAAISRFLQLLDATDHPGSGVDHSIKAQLRNLLSGPSFKDFVEQLCSLYATPTHQHANILSDMDFQRHQPQTVSSSSTIDEKWAGRDISRSSTSPDSWRMRLLVRLYHEAHLDQDNFISSNSLFISRLCEPDNLLIAGREASDLVFDSQSFESHGFTATLLASFKDNIASAYAWGGNEMTAYTAMSLVSRCLVSSGHQEIPSDLYDLVLKIYRWVVKVTVYRELSSPNARIAASAMLLEISKFDMNYGNEAKSEVGPGLLLIKLVEDSDVRIKFELALSIKPVFLRFPLASRIDVYREVVQNLESEEKFIERFALRAYTLMQLALASDDIRRAAMVNLLELGKFVSCKNIVCSCFALIAERLYGSKLDSLFLENSSQFIYSWIEFGYDIFEFPFDVFGFLDFETWALSVKGELISQLLNAGRWDDATDLFRNSIPFEDVLIDCLPKIISDDFLNYSVTEIHESDTAIKCAATLGSDIYRSCLTSRFAESLSIMVDRLDDKTLTEYFSSIDAPASNIFSAINLTQLSPVHPDPPQPFFSASEVLAAIEKFRESLKIPPQQIWSSANSIVVFRHLFDIAISASDTTLVISCLRRIVFVLCVAAEAMYDGYPLEMLLFGLREFLKRSDTYDDALHILQHLLLAGSNYFQSHPLRLRRTILALLSALYSLNRSTSINESVQVAYDLLTYTIGETSTNGSSLHAVTALLEILRGSISYSSLSVGQIMRCLVDEEEELWSAPELCHFGLEVLRSHCNVFTEDLSTLSGIVAHFLRPEWSQSYSEDSKTWLGLAFGVSSWHSRIVEPEFRAPASYNTDHSVPDSEMTCTLFVLNEIFKFMRMEPKISGLLEQSVREVSSRSRIKLPEKFGPDQRTSEYLSSRYTLNAKRPFMDLPTPSQVGFWTVIDKDFDNWCKILACSIALSLPNQLYSSLAYPLHSSTMFCKAIFPYLVEEYQSQRQYDGSLTKIFNTILEITWTVDSLYSKLIIDTILLLRIRFPPTKQRHQSLLEGINYLYASNAAIRCAMYKSALMFLEMSRNSSAEHSDEQVGRLLSQIYRNLDDPDLTYALSQHINRSWDQLLDVYNLHHNRDRVADIRRARLLGKVELGRNLSLEDDDFCAVADFVRQTGFPIKTEDIRGDSLNHAEEDRFVASSYSSAWRLGKWDLPPLVRSKDPDVLVYSVLYHLSRSDLFESFFPVLDKSISRLFDQISFGPNLIDSKNATLSLSILAHVSELFSGTASSLMTTSTRWRQRLVTQAKYGRYVSVKFD